MSRLRAYIYVVPHILGRNSFSVFITMLLYPGICLVEKTLLACRKDFACAESYCAFGNVLQNCLQNHVKISLQEKKVIKLSLNILLSENFLKILETFQKDLTFLSALSTLCDLLH